MRRENENKEKSLMSLYIHIKGRSQREEVKKGRIRRESSEDKERKGKWEN